MATHHAAENEVVDLETWANDIPTEKSKVIARIDEMEIARIVLKTGEVFPEHQVTGPVTVHCIKGETNFTSIGITQTLSPGKMLYLNPNQPHSLKAVSDSVLVLTIVFKR